MNLQTRKIATTWSVKKEKKNCFLVIQKWNLKQHNQKTYTDSESSYKGKEIDQKKPKLET